MNILLAQKGIINPAINPNYGGNTDGGTALGLLIATLFRAVIMVGGLALFVFIVMGGLNWITAGGDEKKVEDARNRITNGIIGMAILVATAAIISFIGGFLGMDLLNLSIPTPTN
jgi:hypothetical protein